MSEEQSTELSEIEESTELNVIVSELDETEPWGDEGPEINDAGGEFFIPENWLVSVERDYLHELEQALQQRYEELKQRYSLTTETVVDYKDPEDENSVFRTGLKITWAPLNG